MGGGLFVHQLSEERATALLGNCFYFKYLAIDDIYQVRKVLEPELAASLAGRLTDDQLAALGRVMHGYASQPKTPKDKREHRIASLRFHAMLAEMSGNARLRFLIRFTANRLSDITLSRQLYAQPNPRLWTSGLDYQSRLIDALRAGDAAQAQAQALAQAIMAQHIETAHLSMRQQKPVLTQRFLAEGKII